MSKEHPAIEAECRAVDEFHKPAMWDGLHPDERAGEMADMKVAILAGLSAAAEPSEKMLAAAMDAGGFELKLGDSFIMYPGRIWSAMIAQLRAEIERE